MRLNNTENCCIAYLLHGFGHAHYNPVHSTFISFANEVKRLTEPYYRNTTDRVFYGFTNSSQSNERKWLTDIGFTSERVGRVHIHYISSKGLKDFFNGQFEEEAKKIAQKEKEEREKRIAERQAAIAAGTLRNKDGSIPRKRGELRVGDSIYRFRIRRSSLTWFYGGIVESVHNSGEVSIRHDTGLYKIRPSYNTGYYNHTVERTCPRNW